MKLMAQRLVWINLLLVLFAAAPAWGMEPQVDLMLTPQTTLTDMQTVLDHLRMFARPQVPDLRVLSAGLQALATEREAFLTVMEDPTVQEQIDDCNFLLQVRAYWVAYTLNHLRQVVSDLMLLFRDYRGSYRMGTAGFDLGDLGDLDDLLDEYDDYMDNRYDDDDEEDSGTGSGISYDDNPMMYMIKLLRIAIKVCRSAFYAAKGLQNILELQQQYDLCVEAAQGGDL